MKVVIGSDHAGFQLKNAMGDLLRSLGHDVLDIGAFNENPSDYPDFAEAGGPRRARWPSRTRRADLRQRRRRQRRRQQNSGIRAGMCHDTYSAHQGVEHDNMNVLVLGSRVIGEKLAADMVRAYLAAKFTNEERHVRRLAKVHALEQKMLKAEI